MNDSLSIYLGKSLKEQWVVYCNQNKIRPGSPLKKYIQIQLINASNSLPEPSVFQDIEQIDRSAKDRYEIRFYKSERIAIAQRAEMEGCSQQKWIINTLRGALTLEPQFTIKEIEALWESSSQVRRLGQNLNHLLKYLNSSTTETVTITKEQIEALTTFIKKHTEEVSKLIHASTERSVLIAKATNKTVSGE